MPKRRKPEPVAPDAPPTLLRDGVYPIAQVAKLCCLPLRTVRREVREGQLRSALIASRRIFLGAWVLDWIASHERVPVSDDHQARRVKRIEQLREAKG